MRLFIAACALALTACPSAKPKPDGDPAEETGEDIGDGEGDEGPFAPQGAPCDEMDCEDDLTCVEYYGIAGPSGPKFTSCEIPCVDDTSCPEGQTCTTIADGPGQVCRAAGK